MIKLRIPSLFIKQKQSLNREAVCEKLSVTHDILWNHI